MKHYTKIARHCGKPFLTNDEAIVAFNARRAATKSYFEKGCTEPTFPHSTDLIPTVAWYLRQSDMVLNIRRNT